VEASNRTSVHFIMCPVAAVDLDDGGFVAVGAGVGSRAAECFGPIGGESLDMIGAEAMAERVRYHLVGHHPLVPRTSKTLQPIVATCCFKHGLHAVHDDNPFSPTQDVSCIRRPDVKVGD